MDIRGLYAQHPEMLAVLVPGVPSKNEFSISSTYPPLDGTLGIYGDIFSTIHNGTEVFILQNPPPLISQNKLLCWTIGSDDLVSFQPESGTSTHALLLARDVSVLTHAYTEPGLESGPVDVSVPSHAYTEPGLESGLVEDLIDVEVHHLNETTQGSTNPENSRYDPHNGWCIILEYYENEWTITNYFPFMMLVGEQEVEPNDGVSLPSMGNIDIRVGQIYLHFFHPPSGPPPSVKTASGDVISIYTPDSEATTVIRPPTPSDLGSADDGAAGPNILELEHQSRAEVVYSKNISTVFPSRGTDHNLIFQTEKTRVNWYQSSGNRLRVIIKTSLLPRKGGYERECCLYELDHLNIIKLWYSTPMPEQFFLEYVPAAKDLSTFRDRENMASFTTSEANKIFTELASAIRYIHGKGILHQDVKTQNVIYSKQSGTKLIDFGICARSGEDCQGGTSCFLPPELAGPARTKASYHSDVYGLGVIAYWILRAIPHPNVNFNFLRPKNEDKLKKKAYHQDFASRAAAFQGQHCKLLSLICSRDPSLRPPASAICTALGIADIEDGTPAGEKHGSVDSIRYNDSEGEVTPCKTRSTKHQLPLGHNSSLVSERKDLNTSNKTSLQPSGVLKDLVPTKRKIQDYS